MATGKSALEAPTARRDTFLGAVLRGLGVLLPPLLTVVILVWAANTIQLHVFQPVTDGVRDVLVLRLMERQDCARLLRTRREVSRAD
jgi:hypothetical protein